MPNTYPVPCSCGKTHEVPGTEAGRVIACSCGKQLEIPTLRELKQSVGEATASPETEIAAKLEAKMLPEEELCTECQRPTDGVVFSQVICETKSVKEKNSASRTILFFLILGPIWSLLHHFIIGGDVMTEQGRDVRFRLPIRLCDTCKANVKSRQAKELLLKNPVYNRLLQKYPHSSISKFEVA